MAIFPRSFIHKAVFAASFLLLGSLTSCFKAPDDPMTNTGGNSNNNRTYNWTAIADSAQLGLNSHYWYASGKFFTMQMGGAAFNSNYWPNAHALDVLTDAYLRKDKDATIKQQMDALIEGVKAANGNSYINYYYDDMSWMMVASLRAYVATGDERFKSVADVLWTDVKGGWDNVTGGGLYWRKDRANKSTPASGPACVFAARLYQVTKNADDLAWATKLYNWLRTNMIQSNGDVWDGINTSVTPYEPDTRLFTYNYGTVLGSALELYKITNDISYQSDAILIADAALARLTRENVLVNGDTGDGGLFNGIFVRYLTRLIIEGDLPSTKRTNYINFLKINAQTLWSKGTTMPDILFGPDWKVAPGLTTSLTPQLSGVMLIEALAELKKQNLVN
ncbi:glycoside hydrolase family 76 protein [Cytophagaceae bacterium YF14B1]|uniref:Glycoside hydrolase family 76 protein n=1 Tax=Xanthocytophaga flava TaxID=3048013 RepID=A0AAE3U7D0_9BACT|nr:glycoside hydrolase family 76 protein [Xanthocytophaga flavus]MDJ1482804.1 glycoside hydrolase family 76 protein [Xanthocytophaga flavus]